MCGYDLRNQTQGQRRFSSIDILLVAAVWGCWSSGGASAQSQSRKPTRRMSCRPPTSIPLMDTTATPTPTATAPPTPTPIPVVQETLLIRHVVQSGETLLSIAIDYDVSVEEIHAPTT